ncbi:MAG: hypothetical protein A2Z21_09305, partial [Candidatus Fraserbacteria bacterium RBG_16_55_9]
MKPIRFSQHVQNQLRKRGATEAEVVRAIRYASWRKAKGDRHECELVIEFNGMWRSKLYRKKKIRPVFVEKST